MNFLFPGFLYALFAVAIPVIIHLFNFRRFKKVYFSNVRFLKDIEFQTSSSRNLKELLILAARILAIIFLVLAFAQPFITTQKQKLSGVQVVSIFVDNSYSMETLNKEGTLLDEAKRRAKEIAAVYNINDKFQLLTNNFEGRHQRLLNYEDFLQAVDEVKITSFNRSLFQILKRQQDVFITEPNSKKDSYVVSDFQKHLLQGSSIDADSTINLHFVQLQANSLPNVSVDSVWFLSPIHRPGISEKVVVQLKNYSDKKAESIPVKLLINSKQKAIGSMSVAPRATRKDTLICSGLSAGWQQAEIQITDYPITFDDHFYFTFQVKQSIQVLAINESIPNTYLQAVYRSDPFFKLDNFNAGNINYAAISTYPLVILNEVNSISTGLTQQLKSYVKLGGNLIVFPSLTGDIAPLTNLLQTLGTDVPEQIVNQENKVTTINMQGKFFAGVFDQIPRNLDLPIAKKYIRYSAKSATNKQAILEFEGHQTFLSQYAVGKGRVYLCAVPLNEDASNFVRHSIFVPTMFQTSLLSMHDNRLFYTLGNDALLETSKITLLANQTLKLKKGAFEAIPEIRQTETNTRLYLADQIKEEGNYKLLKGDSLISTFAFNSNKLESDLSYADDETLHAKFPNQKIDIYNPGNASMQHDLKAAEAGIQIWKLCVILSLIFLAIEILLIRFYRTKKFNSNTI